ncbi:hypothetical protein KEM54_001281 [Ascosphaera aggregata]|nr:hypothetical protein KEM54_001281 [Ascosphaera aggregata]
MADQRIRPHGRDRDRDRDLTDDPERYPRDRDNRGSAGRRRGDYDGRKTRDSDVNDVMQIDPTTTAGSDADADNVDDLIRKTMGFSSFKSTQNTKVPGNNVYGVRKEKKTQYRQYMNRVGGFNRPLSPTR